jgi:hypothetical protein
VAAVVLAGAGCADSTELTQRFETLMEGVDGVVEIETGGIDYPLGSATAEATVVVEGDLGDDDLAAVAERIRPFVAREVGDAFGWQYVDVRRGAVTFEVLADEADTAAQLDLARRVADDPVFAEASLGTHEFGAPTTASDSGSPRRGFGIAVVPSTSSDVLTAWHRARSLRDAEPQLAEVDVSAWSPDSRRFITENVSGFPSALDDPATSDVVLDAADQAELLTAVGDDDLGAGRVLVLPEGIRVDLKEPTVTGQQPPDEVAEASGRAERIASALAATSGASGTTVGTVSTSAESREVDGDLSGAESVVDAVDPDAVTSSAISARSVEVRTGRLDEVVPTLLAMGGSADVSRLDRVRVSSTGSDSRGLAFASDPGTLDVLVSVADAITTSPRVEGVTVASTDGRVSVVLGDAVTEGSLGDVVAAVQAAPRGTVVAFRRNVREPVDLAVETVGDQAAADCSALEVDDRRLCEVVRGAWAE